MRPDRRTFLLAASSCLLGEATRYDGGDKRDPWLLDVLGNWARWEPFCPEAGAGLGMPREPMGLVAQRGASVTVRAVGIETGRDYTAPITAFARAEAARLEAAGVDGVVLKSRSPSCALDSAELSYTVGSADLPGTSDSAPSVDDAGATRSDGLFVRVLKRRLPLVPLVEAERLADPNVLGHFVSRLLLLRRWRAFRAGDGSRAGLAGFHNRHKLGLMAHCPERSRRLGRIAARPVLGDPAPDAARRLDDYQTMLLDALDRPASPDNHARVLSHLFGHVNARLTEEEREEYRDAVSRYRQGKLPLTAPLSLANKHIHRHAPPFLVVQTYLEPHPLESAPG